MYKIGKVYKDKKGDLVVTGNFPCQYWQGEKGCKNAEYHECKGMYPIFDFGEGNRGECGYGDEGQKYLEVKNGSKS